MGRILLLIYKPAWTSRNSGPFMRHRRLPLLGFCVVLFCIPDLWNSRVLSSANYSAFRFYAQVAKLFLALVLHSWLAARLSVTLSRNSRWLWSVVWSDCFKLIAAARQHTILLKKSCEPGTLKPGSTGNARTTCFPSWNHLRSGAPHPLSLPHPATSYFLECAVHVLKSAVRILISHWNRAWDSTVLRTMRSDSRSAVFLVLTWSVVTSYFLECADKCWSLQSQYWLAVEMVCETPRS
jgi:hypothetical protein